MLKPTDNHKIISKGSVLRNFTTNVPYDKFCNFLKASDYPRNRPCILTS